MNETRRSAGVKLAGVLTLVSILMTAPRTLLAQQVFGTVRDSASQLPIPGTVVLVLDPAGRAAARGTTDQQGRFRLSPSAGRAAGRTTRAARARAAARPPGNLRLRVLRMGFRPHEIPLAASDLGTDLAISLVSFPILLDQVEVVAPPGCTKRPDRAAALALLTQVRGALYANVVARSRNSGTMTRLLYQRRFDDEGARVIDQKVHVKVTSATSEPFSAARSAAAFSRQGFLEDSAGTQAYFGPDAETLIDDAFTERYCFRVMAPNRARPLQVGLGFEPPYREQGRIDMIGTLWVDTLSRVLKDLTFRYVGLDRETSALAPEGRLSFRELSNGVVLIDQWSLRFAGAAASRVHAQEIGGEIARATWPDGFSWSAPLGAVRLRAIDGQGRPAVASVVRLDGTDYGATTDASGTIVLENLLPGPYTASVRDPRLAALDLPSSASTRFTAVRDSTIDARLEVETADSFVARRCGRDARAAGEAWIVGRVVTPDGRPVKDARWTMRDEFGSVLVESGRVDADGMFQWCQLPMNKRISIDVTRDDRRTNANQLLSEPLTALRFVLP